jgi:hypothetical protein
MKSQFHVDDPWTGSDPTDANSLRFAEFARLLRLRETWLWIGGPVGALVLLGLMTKPLAALVLPLIALAVGLGVVFWIADRNAANSFWEVYARTRGLALGGKTRLPESTPLLREGYLAYATRTVDGQIVPGLYATLALYTYEEESVGLNGQRETAYHDYTLVTIEVPECAPYIEQLFALSRRGPHPLAEFGDRLRRGRQEVRLESEALDRRLEIFVGAGQDELWTRRLFSPAFVVWLAEEPPRKLSFELERGSLTVYVPGHQEDAKDLDALAAASAAIARRLLEESAQSA